MIPHFFNVRNTSKGKYFFPVLTDTINDCKTHWNNVFKQDFYDDFKADWDCLAYKTRVINITNPKKLRNLIASNKKAGYLNLWFHLN